MSKSLNESRCICTKSYCVDTSSYGVAVFEEGESYKYYASINGEFLLDTNDNSGLIILESESFKYRFMDISEYRNLQLDELIN